MQTKRVRALISGIAVTLVAAGGAFAVFGVANAATNDITLGQTQTMTGDDGFQSTTTKAGTIGAGTDGGNQGGFINFAIPPGGALTGAGTGSPPGSGALAPGSAIGEGGNYRIMTNLWDDNTTWNCAQITGTRNTKANCQGSADAKPSSNLLLSIDSQKTADTVNGRQYEYNTFNANTYFPTGRPGVFTAATCPQTGTFTQDNVLHPNTDLPCHWTPTQSHFPSSYPAMYKGCNFAQCSVAKGAVPGGLNGPVVASAGLPTPLSSVISLKSRWAVNLPAANPAVNGGNPVAPGDGVYDVAYDIWLDRGDNTAINAFPKFNGATPGEGLPDNAYNLEQNNGAEVMLWINNSGYAGSAAPNGTDPSKVITPAGKFIGTYTDKAPTSAGGGGTWDVWVGRQNKPNAVDANGSPTDGGPLGTFKCHYKPDLITPLDAATAANSHCTQWNIVTYVRQVGTKDFNQDTTQFLYNALNYNGGDPNLANNLPNMPASINNNGVTQSVADFLKSSCPQQSAVGSSTIGNTDPGQCISPNWWPTSVQTGMEVWNLGTNGGSNTVGSKLGTHVFTLNPMTALGDPAFAATNTGITGKNLFQDTSTTPTSWRPTIHFNDQWILSYSGCPSADPNATASYRVQFGNGIADAVGTNLLKQTAANSGIWEASVPGVNPGHNSSTVSVEGLPCGDPNASGNVFIDPSGHVVAKNGMAINGASVTIGECTVNNPAANVACPNAPLADITPARVTETTPDPVTVADNSGAGAFRWDVAPGHLYTVTASAPGCTTRTIGPLPVPPVQKGLLIVLDCAMTAPNLIEPSGGLRPTNLGGTGGGGLPTNVVIRAPGFSTHGYCADVFVTNNTNAAVTWNTSFAIPGGLHIAQMWNMTLTQANGQAANVHADANSMSWNAVLQPGQTTHDNGFCTSFS